VPNGNYVSVIERLRPEAHEPGNIVDTKGNVLGKHEGIINFTVGQRKGIKISGEIPYYVIKINPKTKEVIIGKKDELEIKRLKVEDINYLSDKNSDFNEKIFVKVRSTGKFIESKLNVNTGMVYFEKSEYGVSPGQACVFYKPDQLGVRVLGGGWIRATE
jgi:tRNA-specific 2-thiouridylase